MTSRAAVLAACALLTLPGTATAKGDGAHALVAGPGGLYAAMADGGLVRIDPASGRVAATRRVRGYPAALAVAGDTAWAVATPPAGAGAAVRLDARTLARRAGAAPRGVDMIAAGAGTLWAAAWSGRTLTGVDAASGRVIRRVRMPRGIAAIAVGGDRLWVALPGRRPDRAAGRGRGPSALLRLDAATGRRAAPPVRFRGRPWDLVADGRGAWIRAGYRVLIGVDRGRGGRRVHLDTDIASPALAAGAVWVQTTSGLARIDRGDGGVRRVASSAAVFPSRLVAGWGSLWLADLLEPRVTRIDPRTGAETARIVLPLRG